MYSYTNSDLPLTPLRLDGEPTSTLGGSQGLRGDGGRPGGLAVNDLLEKVLRRGDPPNGFLDRLHRLVDCLPEETAA